MSEQGLPADVGVYGGGRMGAGIAHAFLVQGCDVTVVEATAESAAAARAQVERSLARAREKGLVAALGTLSVTTEAADLGAATLVVEAVPELPELKAKVLSTIERHAPGAAIGSNTSSLLIDGLAGALQDPTRLVGLHFFNPVPVSDLIEIVVGRRTDPELVTRAQQWASGLGKTGITVRDTLGSRRAAGDPAREGRPGRARPQERTGLLRLVVGRAA